MNQPFADRERGQALIEYALAVFLTVGLFSVMNFQIKKGIGGIWKSMARMIVAGCPTCEPPEQLN